MKEMREMKTVNKVILSGLFLALAVLLPQLLHLSRELSEAISPMHIPVLICGMLCGYKWGGLAGALAPLISSLTFQMPPIYPVAIWMILELAAYGIVSGILIKKMNIYAALALAMLAGRVVLGISQAVLLGMSGAPYTFWAFVTGAFIKAVPGIVIQLLIIPAIVIIVQKYYKPKSNG